MRTLRSARDAWVLDMQKVLAHIRGGRIVKASHCDNCKHATVKWYEYKGPPAFDVLTCAKKHKPRHYMPRNAMDTDYGWKRVCADFETHNFVLGVNSDA